MARPRKTLETKEPGKRTIVYTRVSTEEQKRKGHGLEDQAELCDAYAERAGYLLIHRTQDAGISGTAPLDQRPGLREAFEWCLSGQADVLLASAADRISRSVGLFDTLRAQLIAAGVRLETVKEARDLTKPEALLMGDIYAAFAAEERRRIAARLYGGRRQRSKKDGRGSGPVPYGYLRRADGAIEIDPTAQLIITKLLQWRRYQTYQKTADLLNRAGHRTPTGSKWTVGHVQGIERHAALYRTGIRQWDGVTAEQPWPILLEEKEA